MLFYSDLSIFQYSKFFGRCHFISFDEKNYYFCQFIYARTKTHVQLRFVWLVSESDFRGQKSSFILMFPSSNIPNSSDIVILFRFIKKTGISVYLFTPKQKLTLNCVLCSWLVNRIFGDKKAVLFCCFRHPIFQILKTL
jgi:hypothetical protein